MGGVRLCACRHWDSKSLLPPSRVSRDARCCKYSPHQAFFGVNLEPDRQKALAKFSASDLSLPEAAFKPSQTEDVSLMGGFVESLRWWQPLGKPPARQGQDPSWDSPYRTHILASVLQRAHIPTEYAPPASCLVSFPFCTQSCIDAYALPTGCQALLDDCHLPSCGL